MIAPLKERTLRRERSTPMHRAHRMVRHLLLSTPGYLADRHDAPPAWRTWLLTLWAAGVTVAYVVAMLR